MYIDLFSSLNPHVRQSSICIPFLSTTLKLPGPRGPADLGSDVSGSTAQPDMEAEGNDRLSPDPVIPDGMMVTLQKYSFHIPVEL